MNYGQYKLTIATLPTLALKSAMATVATDPSKSDISAWRSLTKTSLYDTRSVMEDFDGDT